MDDAEAFEEILDGVAARQPTVAHLLAAYRRGIFPMARGRRGPIDWVEPHVRGVFDLEAFHVPKNLAREVRRGRFEIRTDTAFEKVMRECAKSRGRGNGTWMCEPLLEAYLELFRRGRCHSVEAWLVQPATRSEGDTSQSGRDPAAACGTDGKDAREKGSEHGPAPARTRPKETLVGGLYGVHLGAAFFGESMFSRPRLGGSNASKVCLVHLVERLRRQGFLLLDAQMVNHHLMQFGLQSMASEVFDRRLEAALAVEARWS